MEAQSATSVDVPTTPPPLEIPLVQKFAKISVTTLNSAPIDSKDVYVAGQITIDPNGRAPAFAFSAPMKIKGRGNSTWGMPKKPYKIKLDSSASIMGMPSDKEWVLLANYADKTLMRNIVAMELGRRLSAAYTPRMQIVELTVNGVDQGTYVLTEQVKISPNRVNVSAADVSGGYLVELDQRKDEIIRFETTNGFTFSVKEPSAPTTAQMNYISSYVQSAENAIFSSEFDPVDGYAKYIDVDSFIDWYLVNELFKNQDAAGYTSIYFHKSAGDKLKLGPIWDFDLGAGNVNYSDAQYPEGWWIRQWLMFARLFNDPVFAAKAKARWNYLKAQELNTLATYIDQTAYSLDLVQQKNFMIWDILGIYVWPNPVVTGSYSGEVSYFKQWLQTRINWMDKQFNP